MKMRRKQVKTILMIESDLDEVGKIADSLKDKGAYSFGINHVSSIEEAQRYLNKHSADVVLIDLALFRGQGLKAFFAAQEAAPDASIIVLCDLDQELIAIQAIQAGAQDYLIKGQIKLQELMRTVRNAIDRRNLEFISLSEKNRAQVTLDSIGDAVICTDALGRISFLNPIAEKMTGWSLDDAMGRPLTDAFQIMDATTGEAAPNPVLRAAGQVSPAKLPVNCILTRPDGHAVFIEDSVAPIHDRDGELAGSVLVFRDVSVARAQAAQIAHLAEHDSLTGLPNRLLLNDRLGQAIVRTSRSTGLIAVLFIDLDGFKHINDSLGHTIGDKLLQSVAKRLRDCVRTPDTVSRQGGDEFVVLLQDAQHLEDAAVAATRILKAVAGVHSIEHHDLVITASIGISLYPEDGLDAETLIMNADTAMYQAKRTGPHGYQFFKADMNVRAVERQSIESDLRWALERQELHLHYQPRINLKTGEIAGAEALLRWTHPRRGLTLPLQFISIAEDTGLIHAIGKWVLREACSQARIWVDAGLTHLKMAVNVSPIQLRDGRFLRDLMEILVETGMDSNFLELEVTESVFVERAKPVALILQSLRDIGIKVSVDDFGTGFSSLSSIRRLPVDSLKIDQSFVREITASPGDTTIVSTIISMGRSLRLKVIAEGVETLEELDFLRAEHCEEAQGFRFSKPIPPEQFAKLLGDHMHYLV